MSDKLQFVEVRSASRSGENTMASSSGHDKIMVFGELNGAIRSGRFSSAAFASLRLGENRRLNKEAHFPRRGKDAKPAPFNSQRP
jgi:hypothetical protein